jgi:hypothetical protein
MATRIAFALAIVGGSSLVLAGAQKPQLADLLKTAGAYLAEYSQTIAVTAEEDYVQRDTTTSSAPRRLQSDIVLIGIGNGVVVGHRDIFAVDASKIRERDERLLKLFRVPNPASAQEAAKAMEDESVHYYLSPNLRTLDAPGLALEFLREANQANSEFALEGVRKSGDLQIATVKFVERPTSRILPTPEGAKTSGKFWIDVATGAVTQTELTVDHREYFRFHIATKFAKDAAVGAWVPAEVLQDVDIRTPTNNAHSNMGAGGQLGSRRSFEGRIKYSKYRRLGL